LALPAYNKTIERPSVCLINRLQQRRAAGLLLSAGMRSIDSGGCPAPNSNGAAAWARSMAISSQTGRQRADIIGAVLVPWADHFQC